MICEELLRTSVIEYIHESVEKVYGVRMLFCAETGSRGYGTHITTSDMDIKGIYVCVNEEDYLTVKDMKKIIQKTGSELKLKDGTMMELDYTFIDVRKFLKRKVRGGKIDQFNLWCSSEKVYINNFDEPTYRFFSHGFKLPYVALNGHLKTFAKIFSKSGTSKMTAEDKFKVKEILNSIVVGCMHLHMILFQRFPIYNTWKQMDYLLEYAEKSKVEEESTTKSLPIALDGLKEIKEIALQLFETKKSARLGEIDVVDPKVITWLNQLFDMYKEFSPSLPADYHDAPEISSNQANEIFDLLRKQAIKSVELH